ncbi:MAG: TRAP transporter permease, partial [Anaerotignaceae bacterium]
RKDTRMSFTTFLEALENGARNTIGVAIACSIAGIIVGVVTLTGLGLKLATGLLTLSGGITIVALFFTMIACIILGMGVPTTANYVIMATITAPIVIRLGIPMLAAHMFVFYFGIVADITPPVALAAYAGSAIARSDPFKTGLTATRIAITAFIIPYIFAFNPDLLLVGGSVGQALFILITAFIGMIGIAAGMEGYMIIHLKAYERLICLVGGIMLIIPDGPTDIIGVIAIAIIFVLQEVKTRKKAVQE